jgi:hypothetical protein
VIWLIVCAGGLIAETSLIVVLGRRSTGAFGTPVPDADTTGSSRIAGGRGAPGRQSGTAAGGSDMDE